MLSEQMEEWLKELIEKTLPPYGCILFSKAKEKQKLQRQQIVICNPSGVYLKLYWSFTIQQTGRSSSQAETNWCPVNVKRRSKRRLSRECGWVGVSLRDLHGWYLSVRMLLKPISFLSSKNARRQANSSDLLCYVMGQKELSNRASCSVSQETFYRCYRSRESPRIISILSQFPHALQCNLSPTKWSYDDARCVRNREMHHEEVYPSLLCETLCWP